MHLLIPDSYDINEMYCSAAPPEAAVESGSGDLPTWILK